MVNLRPSGLIDSKEVLVTRWGFGWRVAQPGEVGSEPGTLCVLNAKAKPYACRREVALQGQRQGLRYGTPQLIEIVQSTTPTDTPLGRLTHVPAWARDPSWQKASFVPADLRAPEQRHEGTMMLIHTNRGWRAQP